jgi:pyruvate carboxylase subunit B
MISQEVKDYVKGMYGRSPAPVDPAVAEMALGGAKPIDCRPADLIEPELQKARAAMATYSDRLEDALSYALFPQVALAFHKAHAEGKAPATTEPLPENIKPKGTEVKAVRTGAHAFSITVGGTTYGATVENGIGSGAKRALGVLLDGGQRLDIAFETRGSGPAKSARKSQAGEEFHRIKAPMPGMVVQVFKKIGDVVAPGDVVLLLEAMKMQNEIQCRVPGRVKAVHVEAGASVDKGTLLVELDPEF